MRFFPLLRSRPVLSQASQKRWAAPGVAAPLR